MKILYQCDYCNKGYDKEWKAHKCEMRHESWKYATVKIEDMRFNFHEDGAPCEILLRLPGVKPRRYHCET